MVDLDGFKDVNDAYGHAVGDDVLRLLGPRLLACVRPTDMVARLGGDEFVILCEDAGDREVVEQMAARVREACSEPFGVTAGRRVRLSGSVGTAWSSEQVRTPAALLAAADLAMYVAKRTR
jgi:diguanylate cyclase (GGDEF)-like protein